MSKGLYKLYKLYKLYQPILLAVQLFCFSVCSDVKKKEKKEKKKSCLFKSKPKRC